jgi:ATP-dependent DNA ligase
MTTVNRNQPEVASIGAKAGFFEPMLCLAVEKLPEGPAWQYEVKLDGYRAIGVRTRSAHILETEIWSYRSAEHWRSARIKA